MVMIGTNQGGGLEMKERNMNSTQNAIETLIANCWIMYSVILDLSHAPARGVLCCKPASQSAAFFVENKEARKPL